MLIVERPTEPVSVERKFSPARWRTLMTENRHVWMRLCCGPAGVQCVQGLNEQVSSFALIAEIIRERKQDDRCQRVQPQGQLGC